MGTSIKVGTATLMEFFSRCLISWSFTKYDKTKKHLHNPIHIHIHIDKRSVRLWEILTTYEVGSVEI